MVDIVTSTQSVSPASCLYDAAKLELAIAGWQEQPEVVRTCVYTYTAHQMADILYHRDQILIANFWSKHAQWSQPKAAQVISSVIQYVMI